MRLFLHSSARKVLGYHSSLSTPATSAPEATTPAATEKATITKSEFEQIENGMALRK
ncbi:hypothetical protein [Brevibacillus sp. MS2.2]|uniref:hypothetical protein n=1 Tax=Brevibacillus sp. MS2.2 TaxID=2738981 RepID=UPI0020C1C6D7|nr:hypothetical protein [Brevibacillus sp. MS2.2]